MHIAKMIFVLASCLLLPAKAMAADIKLVTTNGLRAVIGQIGPQFERETGNKLVVRYGAGPVLKKEIESGASFDVAILPLDIADLIAKKIIVAESRKVLGRTGYGAAVIKGARKPDISTADSLRRALLNAKGVSYAAEGVSGVYFQNVLSRLGIADQMQGKTIPSEAAAGSMSALASGQAEIAIGGIAVILSAPSVDLVGWLPSEVQSYLVFTAGVSSSSGDIRASTAFLNKLSMPEATATFEAAGIAPVSR